MAIFRENFHFHEVEKLDEESILALIPQDDKKINPNKIEIKANWKKFKNIIISIDSKPIFFIKEIWETGAIKELLALHIARYFLEPSLFAENYVFGLHYPKGKKRGAVPFILNTIVEGEPLPKRGWEKYSFILGRHYKIHEILSLYDCEMRHFLADGDNVKRIDLGLAFYHMDHRYRGFEEYMPKGLPYMRDFWRGYDMERQRLNITLLNTRDDLKQLLSEIEKLKSDDLVNFYGKKFVSDLKGYWKSSKLPIIENVNWENEEIFL